MDESKMFAYPKVENQGANEMEAEKIAEKNPEMKKMYQGIWANHLENGQLLPVGGSIFRPDLDTQLVLDFESFEEELKTATPERLEEVYQTTGESKIIEYLNQLKSDIDPRLFFACLQAQKKIGAILNTENAVNSFERAKKYSEENAPKLSELVGNAMCVERAALGQFVLQKIGIESSYMSGIVMFDPDDREEFPENHSFLVVTKDGKKYVFDIARPHNASIPSIFEMPENMDAELFENRQDLLVKGEDVLSHSTIWFGIGSATAGSHTKLQKDI